METETANNNDDNNECNNPTKNACSSSDANEVETNEVEDVENLVNFNNEVEQLNKKVKDKENESWAMKTKNDTLQDTNDKLAEENKTMNASLESYKNYVERKDKISALLSAVTCYNSNEAKASAIESFAKSTMPIEDIDRFYARPMRAIR